MSYGLTYCSPFDFTMFLAIFYFILKRYIITSSAQDNRLYEHRHKKILLYEYHNVTRACPPVARPETLLLQRIWLRIWLWWLMMCLMHTGRAIRLSLATSDCGTRIRIGQCLMLK